MATSTTQGIDALENRSPTMSTFTAQEIDALAKEQFLNEYNNPQRPNGLVFALQVHVPHELASGAQLRVGYLANDDKKTWVWALVIFNDGVHFYTEGARLFPKALKHVKFDEPMRTLALGLEEKISSRLQSYIYYLFINKGALSKFIETKTIRFNRFKASCMRIAWAKEKGFYGTNQDARRDEVGKEDEGYESDEEDEDELSALATGNKRKKCKKRGRKRKHDGEGEMGDMKRTPEDYRAKYEGLLKVNKILQEKLDRHDAILDSLKDFQNVSRAWVDGAGKLSKSS